MNKLYVAISLILLMAMPIAEARRQHHIKRFKLVSIKLLPPPPVSDMTMIKPSEQMSFKETCAMIALEHTLETCESKEQAIDEAWGIADQMDKQRLDHK